MAGGAVIGGGGSISRRQLMFSDDGKLLILACGSALRLYSTATGEPVASLAGHTADITCVTSDPKSPKQVYTSSIDGSIRLWDYEARKCVRVLSVREAIQHVVINARLDVAYLSIHWREGASGRVLAYDLLAGKAGRTAMKTRSPAPVVCSAAGGLVATHDRHSLFVWRAGHEILQPLNLHHTKPYTCVALSCDDRVLAAGDVSGRILIWRDFHAHVPLEKREGSHAGKHHPEGAPVPVTTLHWHAHPVGCLAFSSDAVFLLSGGAEGVLVQWQLDGARRAYLPRLGGPLVGLTPNPADPAQYCVRQRDNTLRVVNTASMKVECSVLGLRPPPAGVEWFACSRATALQPGSGALAVPCDNSVLQFYDAVHDRHVGQLAVAPRNATSDAAAAAVDASTRAAGNGLYSGASAAAAAAVPHVSHLAFSADGSAMVTVDSRPDAGPFGSSLPCLKFWDHDASGAAAAAASTSGAGGAASFALNTLADDPHGSAIHSLCFHPSLDLAVTTGGDAAFRVWSRAAPAPRKQQQQQQQRPGAAGGGAGSDAAAAPPPAKAGWRLRSSAGYKDLPLTCAAFSPDGSALAVAAGSKVTLWDPLSNALGAVLTGPPPLAGGGPPPAPLHSLAFVPRTAFLVGASGSSLVVWDLLTCAVRWSYSLPVCSLAADPLHRHFAVALRDLGDRPPEQQQQQQQHNPLASPPGVGAAAAATASAHKPSAHAGGSGAATPDTPAPGDASAYPAPGSSAATAANGSAAAAAAAPLSSTVCHVLLFRPERPEPRFHCAVRGSAAAQVLYLPPGSAAHGACSHLAPGGTSPLMILSEGRAFGIGMGAQQAAEHAGAPDADAQPAAAEDGAAGVSAFEAAFGKLDAAPAVLQPVDAELELAPGDVLKQRLQALFDAPSHLLPPPTRLAPAFLQLLSAAAPAPPAPAATTS